MANHLNPSEIGIELPKAEVINTLVAQAQGCFKPGTTDLLDLPRYGTSYPLGSIELIGLNGLTNSADTIEGKIHQKAEDDVRKNMTPQERAQLDSDQSKYEAASKAWDVQYEKWHRAQMMGTGGFADVGEEGYSGPKPPEEPASIQKYDADVDKEYKKRIQAADDKLKI